CRGPCTCRIPSKTFQKTAKTMSYFCFWGPPGMFKLKTRARRAPGGWGGTKGGVGGKSSVLVTRVCNDSAGLARAGNYHSDKLHVVERITATGPDHLNYEATIEDPNVFTRPWKISMPLYRRMEKNAQVLEYKCVEFAEDVIYGHLRKVPLTK